MTTSGLLLDIFLTWPDSRLIAKMPALVLTKMTPRPSAKPTAIASSFVKISVKPSAVGWFKGTRVLRSGSVLSSKTLLCVHAAAVLSEPAVSLDHR